MTLTFRSEEHTSELQSHSELVCRLLLEKKKKTYVIWISSIFCLKTTTSLYNFTLSKFPFIPLNHTSTLIFIFFHTLKISLPFIFPYPFSISLYGYMKSLTGKLSTILLSFLECVSTGESGCDRTKKHPKVNKYTYMPIWCCLFTAL